MVELLQTPVGRLRIISILEGISYLLLLGVAVPLKYAGGIPVAVSIAGPIHGVLFLLLIAALFHASEVRRWSWAFIGIIVLAALLPFGAFWLETKLRKEVQA
ncbi:MAG: DUF3817 domain-containing protein [Candidatus Methylacidiphilales bacterium]|nr:DUF3817 domain-containing protein [Candidatus Methylacidiphilales bacterium]